MMRSATGAHPRSRGENAPACEPAFSFQGSSPLTRGKLSRRRALMRSPWLIPAHAGKTGGFAGRGMEAGAHPRSRGENRCAEVPTSPPDGSSPLTRGKPASDAWLTMPERLIPAHAGKTCRGRRSTKRTRAHPRSRGENQRRAEEQIALAGSSPLTRGKPRMRCTATRSPGLIPAHAGKTCGTTPLPSIRRAHPRSRGENGDQAFDELSEMGSSPLTRGKPCLGWSAGSVLRLIPAHAGKTWSGARLARRWRAHPRSRVENTF